ncbi:MAG: class II aldolase/adducin family protein [Candidatus Njordarchaeum guaymaensis]
MKYSEIRNKIVEIGRFLLEKDLTVGSSGNISVFIPDNREIVITPSMIPFRKMKPEDLLVVDLEGNVIEGERNPSVESQMHIKIYENRKNVNAIIHAHPIYASAFAVSQKAIPPILDELAVYTGGAVHVAKYALPGTEELANNALDALKEKKAVLLANHGILVCGKNLDDALDVLIKVERTAKIYILAKIIGEVKLLPESAIKTEIELYEVMNEL